MADVHKLLGRGANLPTATPRPPLTPLSPFPHLLAFAKPTDSPLFVLDVTPYTNPDFDLS
jgi:hypothetical protein